MTPATRVFVVDDHALVRHGITQLIDLEKDLEVVGEGSGSAQIVDAIVQAKPDVVLVDLEMPDVRGAELIGLIRNALPSARILVCTMHGSYAYVADALQAGADGYVLKSSPSTLLMEGIRRVAVGQGHIDPALQSEVIKRLQHRDQLAVGQELTAREIEALRLAAEGLGNQEIASRTGQSVETVKLRLRRSFHKLGASDRASAVAVAMRRNLIP